MKLFDSHCHLDERAYKNDLDQVLRRARDAGVTALMTVGADKHSSQTAVALAESEPGLFASVGTHPHDAKSCNHADLEFLKNLAKSKKVKAWGEIGLDFNRMYSPRKVQEHWFAAQLDVADELGLPIIFHERDSKGRLLEILNTYPNPERKGVIHCFSGNPAELEQYIDMGFYIGVTGILTLQERGQSLRRMAPSIPSDCLVIETDAPYLTPAPEKNQTRRNEPAFVRSVLNRLAEVRNDPPESLAATLWENTCRLYDITDLT